jgi:type II restriction/modification system DNA methylase subunit YeeA
MEHPDELRPDKTRDELTADAAEQFASLAERLRSRDHDPHEVAHFLNKLLFCMFAEDSGLLPKGLMKRLAEAAKGNPSTFATGLGELFLKMSHGGGLFGAERIQWFNGGLFDGGETLPLTAEEIGLVERVSRLDWSQVEPAIFGTLFERGLDPSKRSQLGAHYTDREAILRLVEPVLIEPLRRDFEATMERVEALVAEGKKITARTPASKNPEAVFGAFLARLRAVRVLDPACGSGNFLYLALQSLKSLEREAILWGSLKLQGTIQLPEVGPQAVLGIELNDYAAELARVVIWIGEIQWMLANGFGYRRDPILRPLNNIECRDAVLDLSDPENPSQPEWPEATVIVGNPPFLGGTLMRASLGDEYVDALRQVYEGRVARGADFVCYWYEAARGMLDASRVERVGLLATQGIRGGASQRVLTRIKETGNIFFAWSDERWVVDGAAVHVSFVGFDDGSETSKTLDGSSVTEINADLTAGIDLTRMRRLSSNSGISFMGDKKGGPFEIPETMAREMLATPNPDGRANSDVVRPWINGRDITMRPRRLWIIDFGVLGLDEAVLYEEPFEYVKRHVFPIRVNNRRTIRAERWWLHHEPMMGLRNAPWLTRFIATPRVSKHRLFVWVDKNTVPDSATVAFARDDDYFFGVLHSSVHELWARRLGTQVREAESGFRYTPTTTFETFSFPEPTDHARAEVGEVAKALDALRTGWLNPPDLAASDLQKRTLTNLYNQRPSWLAQAHERLDRAVHAAYGWEYPLEPEEVLARLVELNLSTASTAEA